MWTYATTSLMLIFVLTQIAVAQSTLPTVFRVPYGPPHEERLAYTHYYVEPGTDHRLRIVLLSPHRADTMEGAQTYKIWYQVSNDEGATYDQLRQLILEGDEFDMYRPIRGVDIRKVGFTFVIQIPFRASNGEIMLPIEAWRLDEKGEAYNPASPYTYCDSAVLIGRWTEDRRDVEWAMGQRVQLALDQSSAGGYEPALGELSTRGHFVMAMRASNIYKPEIQSYKWMAISKDYCRTWSEPKPLTYINGENFFSPASCSSFFRHSNGKMYWIGNIIPHNAQGNLPRDPLVIAEFDEITCGIRKETVQILFTRDPKVDSPRVEFSNFTVREDAQTGKLHIKAPRLDRDKVTAEELHTETYPWVEAVLELK
jgi:hypothetical protein